MQCSSNCPRRRCTCRLRSFRTHTQKSNLHSRWRHTFRQGSPCTSFFRRRRNTFPLHRACSSQTRRWMPSICRSGSLCRSCWHSQQPQTCPQGTPSTRICPWSPLGTALAGMRCTPRTPARRCNTQRGTACKRLSPPLPRSSPQRKAGSSVWTEYPGTCQQHTGCRLSTDCPHTCLQRKPRNLGCLRRNIFRPSSLRTR